MEKIREDGLVREVLGFIKKHYKLIGFALGWGIIFADLLICDNRATYYDANGYDVMADCFKNNGLFHFWIEESDGYTDLFSIRGYGWPFILAVCKILGMGRQRGCWLFYSAFVASGLAFALPEFISGLFSKKVNAIARAVPAILSICFWNGLILYPLSDVPSVITVAWGLMLLTKIAGRRRLCCNMALALAAGFLLGISYYIRSGCMPAIALSLLIILLYKMKGGRLRKAALVISMCIGVMAAAAPQVMINQSFNHRLSYEVPIFFNTGIADMEYYYGFQALRYETNISGVHPEAAMVSYDSLIDHILAVEDIAREDVGLRTVLGLCLKYPLEFMGLYAAKLANCIDPRYGNELYIKDLNARQYPVMVCNYLLWFLGALGLGLELNRGDGEASAQWGNAKLFLKEYFIYILAFLVPALVHLAGTHIEARYFYPCYALMYAYLGMLCPWKDVWTLIRKRLLTAAAICIAVFACLNSIWNFTFENFHYPQLLLEDGFRHEDVSREEFLQLHADGLAVEYDIWSFGMKDQTYLSLSGYIVALNEESEGNRLSLVLSAEGRQYLYDINLTSNPYKEGPYTKSKFSINKELIGLDAGDYQVGFLLENGAGSKAVLTEQAIEVIK